MRRSTTFAAIIAAIGIALALLPSSQPAQAFGFGAIAAGGSQTCALNGSGNMQCWGSNFRGQLGDGTTTNHYTPNPVSGLGSSVRSITAGDTHTCAVTSSGGAKCWGDNYYGELGNGTTSGLSPNSTPVDVTGLTSGVASIDAGVSHTCAVTTTGGAKCWGYNADGELGNGTTADSSTPVDVTGLTSGVSAIAGGGLHTCALMTSGNVKCWGFNYAGELGNGTYTNSTTPVDVTGLSGVAIIASGLEHSCALLTAGDIKCWGDNYDGQLGDGTTTTSNVPVSVIGLAGQAYGIAAGVFHTCAPVKYGLAQCWGDGSYGQLGDGTTAGSSSPVTSNIANVAAVAADAFHTCALNGHGNIRCWGNNGFGQLGNGTTTGSSTPVFVPGPPDKPCPDQDFDYTCDTYDYDLDGDHCPNDAESGPDPTQGGQRNMYNPWDYFNPTGDGLNRSDDVAIEVMHYGHDDLGDPMYSRTYDRTPLAGGQPWQFGPPDGMIRTADISAAVRSYGHDCS